MTRKNSLLQFAQEGLVRKSSDLRGRDRLTNDNRNPSQPRKT
jgi:hypothetical protein